MLTLYFNQLENLNRKRKYFIYVTIFIGILICLFRVFLSSDPVKVNSEINEAKAKIKHRNCYKDICYSNDLTDQVRSYLEESYLSGTRKFLKRKRDIFILVEKGELIEIEENEFYVLDTLPYSYPFLTPTAKNLLDEIGDLFQRKLENTGLECTRFTITSMLRTTSSVARLRKKNKNSIKNSAHLHGTTFDISYRSFLNKLNSSH